jgi:chemosensory pili system protein ChpA (sensor histidine kinase/response regulator)
MSLNIDPELLDFFIEEAVSYLAPMRESLAALREDSGSAEHLERIHRHAHSIKGSAALLGIPGLTHTAYQLEDLFDEIIENRYAWNDDILRVTDESIGLIEETLVAIKDPEYQPDALTARTDSLFATLPNRAVLQPVASEEGLSAYASEEGPGAYATGEETPEPFPLPTSFGPEEASDSSEEDTVLDYSSDRPAATQELDAILNAAVVPQKPVTLAEILSPELLEIFSLEAEEHLRAINTSLPLLQEKPSDKDLIQTIRRSAHTLKGAAAMVGFQAITKLAHRMEDVLDVIYESTGPVPATLFPVLFKSADALTDLAAGNTDDARLKALFTDYDAAMKSLVGGEEIAPSTKPEVDEAEVAAQIASATKRSGQYVRVPIERLDELSKLIGELVIARTAFEQRATDYIRMTEELQLSSGRLKKCSTKLETEYETRALATTATTPKGQADKHDGFDDLELDRYTDFHLITRELAETTTDVQTIGIELGHLYGDIEGFLTRKSRITTDIQDKLMRIRMVPLESLATQLHRTVRTTADTMGKPVALSLEGETTEVDKTVLEDLAEPLLHLLRNAVDHGLETPAERTRAGKPAKGNITVKAFQEGPQIVVQVKDDGRGIDVAAVRAKAISGNHITAENAANLSEAEVYRLLFLPGFSTAKTISEISGRGVGLDIVLAKVQKLKGTIAVESIPGDGTTFSIRLPLTLAVTRALLLQSHSQTFAMPLGAVEQIIRLDEEPENIGGKPVLRFDGKLYPLIHLGTALQLPVTTDEATKRPPVLLLNTGENRVGVVVDKVLGGREIVVKNLGNHIRTVRGVSGATLMGDGSVVLILNPADLITTKTKNLSTSAPKRVATVAKASLRVMIVDDSPSVRRVVSSLIKKTGWTEISAKDGLDAIEILQRSTVLPDLILSDVEMPRMDGYELLSTLKNQASYRAIPVVMMTSRSGEKHRKKALGLGASAYVVKPYQDEALLTTIRQLAVRS